MTKQLLVTDITLRDGNHAVAHQLTREQMSAYATAADAAGVQIVEVGHGNGIGGVDGVLGERILGTYLHGPVLPRNPTLADHLLTWVVGTDAVTPLADELVEHLRAERLADATLTGFAARRRDWHLNRG